MTDKLALSSSSVRWAFNYRTWNPTEQEWHFATSSVSLQESERIQKFVFQVDAKASLAGCLMIRKLVHLATGAPYDKIDIVRDLRGRPTLKDPMIPIDFNVSHQGDWTVLAAEVRSDRMVGVDIMNIPRKTDDDLTELFRLTKRTFTEDEWNAILASEETEKRTAMFFRFWCLKESYTKAIGVGICTDLRRISFKIKNTTLYPDKPCTDTTVVVDGVENAFWRFHEWLLDSNHCVAVALSSPSADPAPFNELSWADLVNEATM